MRSSVGMQALAVKYPSVLRTNDFWRKNYPELIEHVESKGAGKVWTGPEDSKGPSALFDSVMFPYLSDPFRGTVGRRVLGPGEDALTLEVDAARLVLDAAGRSADDIDCIISVGFQPKYAGYGNGAQPHIPFKGPRQDQKFPHEIVGPGKGKAGEGEEAPEAQ